MIPHGKQSVALASAKDDPMTMAKGPHRVQIAARVNEDLLPSLEETIGIFVTGAHRAERKEKVPYDGCADGHLMTEPVGNSVDTPRVKECRAE